MKSSKQTRWIVARVNGRIACVSVGYAQCLGYLASIAPKIPSIEGIAIEETTLEELFALGEKLRWDDLLLVGSPFRLKVWKAIFDITHDPEGGPLEPSLVSYSSLAEMVGSPKGVRTVATAVGENPIPVIIPCHLIIPLPSNRRMEDIDLQNNLFRWKALSIMDSNIDYGEYALGSDLKREIIRLHMARG